MGLTSSPLFLIHTRYLNSKNGGWPSYPPSLTLPFLSFHHAFQFHLYFLFTASSSQSPPPVSWDKGVTSQLSSVKILVKPSCRASQVMAYAPLSAGSLLHVCVSKDWAVENIEDKITNNEKSSERELQWVGSSLERVPGSSWIIPAICRLRMGRMK